MKKQPKKALRDDLFYVGTGTGTGFPAYKYNGWSDFEKQSRDRYFEGYLDGMKSNTQYKNSFALGFITCAIICIIFLIAMRI